MIKNKFFLHLLILLSIQFSIGLAAHAGIVSTNIVTEAEIINSNKSTFTDSNSDSLSASASVTDSDFGGTVDTHLAVLSLAPQATSLGFGIMWDGGSAIQELGNVGVSGTSFTAP